MQKKAVIAQVTDMHIEVTEKAYRNINVCQNFVNVLQTLENKSIDLLVLSGDLAASNGEVEAYQWLQKTLAAFPYPYVVMAGNHDRVPTMANIFQIPNTDIHDGMLYFSRRVKGYRILFLDTSTYTLPRKQLIWLHQQLYNSDEPVLLFIHHPPALCDCRFMDSFYPLKNISETWAVLEQLTAVKHIFCGHYHTEKIIERQGKMIYLTPSTTMQIDPISADFAIEHTRPGWRMIEWEGEQVDSYVEYLY